MAVPQRKSDTEFDTEEITTADIAQPRNPAGTAGVPRPVISERVAAQPTVEQSSKSDESTPLFPSDELETLRGRWKEVQTAFVDEPRKAVEQADSLVAAAMKRLAEVFAEERANLEKQWDRGDTVSTEDLRVALQRYRTFFQRLLAV